MREIKFNFVYGIDGNEETYFTKTFNFGEIESGSHMEEICNNPLMSDYSIVGKRQYTGLHDKSGKEIYEGDIIKYKNEIEYGTGVIKSFFDTCNLHCEWIEQETTSLSIYTSIDYLGCKEEVEIIGNIYENPELGEKL